MKSRGFQFKQFFIEHTNSAMKVGTDSILLGSWTELKNAQNILDIGTGSGLLAIMLAQKSSSNCRILGVDIDSEAINQAKINAEQSPWSQQLFFEVASIQNFRADHSFDLIVANPPYFPINHTANLKQNQNKRVNARQITELNHRVLLENVVTHLSKYGIFCCVLPAECVPAFIDLADSVGLFCIKELKVKAQPQGKIIRYLLTLAKVHSPMDSSELSIYGEKETYSAEYRKLCKEYYLNF